MKSYLTGTIDLAHIDFNALLWQECPVIQFFASKLFALVASYL